MIRIIRSSEGAKAHLQDSSWEYPRELHEEKGAEREVIRDEREVAAAFRGEREEWRKRKKTREGG